MLLPNHSLVDTTVTRLRCMTGRTDCCTSANSKWYLPSGFAVTTGISSYGKGGGSTRGAIELYNVSSVPGNQGIHRCTLPQSDPAAITSTISVYVGIYDPRRGECIAYLVTGFKFVIIIEMTFIIMH